MLKGDWRISCCLRCGCEKWMFSVMLQIFHVIRMMQKLSLFLRLLDLEHIKHIRIMCKEIVTTHMSPAVLPSLLQLLFSCAHERFSGIYPCGQMSSLYICLCNHVWLSMNLFLSVFLRLHMHCKSSPSWTQWWWSLILMFLSISTVVPAWGERCELPSKY